MDVDLAAHFTVIKKTGLTLCGMDKDKVFYNIPKSAYLHSIESDIKNAESDIAGENALYIVMNLCRVLAYKEKGYVLSKKDGVQWALLELPSSNKLLLEEALRCYAGSDTFDASTMELKRFARYMMKKIFGDCKRFENVQSI